MRARFRRASVVAAAAAAVLAISGCTISNAPSASDSPGTTTLKFWQYYSAGGQADWLKAQNAKFEAANPGVKVQLVQVVGSQQDQKLLAAVATGNGPDLLINNIVVDFPTLVGGGVMKDITAEWNAYPDKDQYPEAAAWKSDGKVYNLLSYTNLLGMFYNKDILASVGITEPPTTLEQLEADMAKVNAGGKYKALAESGAPTVEGAWLFAPQLLGKGINYCNFSGQPVTDAFNRIADWAQKGYLPKATATWDQNASWQQFMTGKYAFGLNGNWQLGNVKKAKFAYGTTQFPAPAGGKSVVYPGGEGIAIGAQSKHPDLAWKYLQEVFLSKDGGQSLFAAAGSIPVRADVAGVPEIQKDTYVQPFIKAAQTSGQWPNNPKTADMQTALGKAVSGVISGQLSGPEGAEQAIKNVAAAQKSGGGTCK
jgi:multiple sugar transport system substrate-binding protein